MTTEIWVGRHGVDVRMLLKWYLNSVWRCLRLRSSGDLLCSRCWTLRYKTRCEYCYHQSCTNLWCEDARASEFL